MKHSKNTKPSVTHLSADATQAEIRAYCKRNKPQFRTTVNKVGRARTRA